jgi:hypothetical protein
MVMLQLSFNNQGAIYYEFNPEEHSANQTVCKLFLRVSENLSALSSSPESGNQHPDSAPTNWSPYISIRHTHEQLTNSMEHNPA